METAALRSTNEQDWLSVRAESEHFPFIAGTFKRSLREQPLYHRTNIEAAAENLLSMSRQPGYFARVATLRSDPGNLLSWIVANPARRLVVFAFTKYPLRRMGLAGSMCIEAGIDPTQGPIGVGYWTYPAERIARKDNGWRIYHALPGFDP